MSPYYSKQSSLISNFSDLQTVCGIPILPLRGSSVSKSGPCPILTDNDYSDIVSEALEFFRFNSLVKSRFDLKSGPDKILIHLTLWIHHCLHAMDSLESFSSLRQLVEFLYSVDRVDFLTRTQFLFSKPFSKKDQQTFREYLDQLQIETCHRLANCVWTSNKPQYWSQYGRINILGIYWRFFDIFSIQFFF